jgi:hypothetical protein
MIDTYTKVILTVIAAAMVAQLAMSVIDGPAVGQLSQTCGNSGDPCYVTFSVLDAEARRSLDTYS